MECVLDCSKGLMSVTMLLDFAEALLTRVPPWSWKVMEFRKTIFQTWKVMENSKGHGKSWKMIIMSCNYV